MSLKITKKNLRKIILQEIRKLTEAAWWEEEGDDPDPGDKYQNQKNQSDAEKRPGEFFQPTIINGGGTEAHENA